MTSLSPISIPFKIMGRLFSRGRDNQKVLMVTQYLFLGGLERMILNLATSLKADLGWQPSVFVFDHAKYADASSHLGDLFESEGIAVTYFSKSAGFSFKAVLKIVETLVRQEIGVIHTHDLGALIYGGLAKIVCLGSVRLVHTQHSFVHLGRKKRYRFYELFFTSLVDELAVVSEDTRETYRSIGVASSKIRFVPNGVRFAEPIQDKIASKRAAFNSLQDKNMSSSLGLFTEAQWILYMARVHGRKGQNHAVKLWSALEPEFRRKMVLLFVGLETEKGELEKLRFAIAAAPDSDRILYLGPSHQPMLWLRAADIFLSCSEFEGMPLASIEAAGSGLPLVLSSIAGHESLKSHSAQYALENPEQGAKALQKIASKVASEGSHYFDSLWRAAVSIRDPHSVSRMATQYSRLYKAESKNGI